MVKLTILLVIILIVVIVACIFLMMNPGFLNSNSGEDSLKRMVNAQRGNYEGFRRPEFAEEARRTDSMSNPDLLFESADKVNVKRVVTSKLTLEKKLKYGRWKIPPIAFWLIVVFTSVVAYYLVSLKFNKVLQVFALIWGPLFIHWLLSLSIDKRFKAFDADFPPFLQSLVSMLKVGQNPMVAVRSACETLGDNSLVKFEVNLMLDRLRLGVSEEQSIGTFAEDVYHPEIELFVQALLLSRRVGGTLSDTLERLAAQCRKRQYFRNSANAAVGMQKGSIWFILGIMVMIELYLYYQNRESVMVALNDPMGWQIWQTGIILILFGVWWVRQVTKLKI